jgi:mono/diheme cytochrome c family protein
MTALLSLAIPEAVEGAKAAPALVGIYERIYDSAWHHPMLCWLAAPFILAALIAAHERHSSPFHLRYALSWLVLIVLDALWTGAVPPLPPEHPVTRLIPIAFVLLGDTRYFQLVETILPAGGRPRTTRAALLRALLLALIVPVTTTALRLLQPQLVPSMRVLYLIYELLFVALLLVLLVILPRRLRRSPRTGQQKLRLRTVRVLTAFELAQYGLWALCDALILHGVDAALLLRIVPNLLYYVAFVPFAYFVVPATLRLPLETVVPVAPEVRSPSWTRRLGRLGALGLAAVHALLLWLKPDAPPIAPAASAPAPAERAVRESPTPPPPGAPKPVAAPAPTAADAATLHFLASGSEVAALQLDALRQLAPVERVTAPDPYYGRTKSFDALPIEPLLAAAFGVSLDELRGGEFVLRARDGYAVPLPGARLLEGGAYVAFADAEGWQPIGPQAADPRPFYLIWKHPTQRDLASHPRPFQLVTIERLAVADRPFPAATPRVAAGTPAARGFALFRARCIACHAMNRDGGRIGPDLNVPQNITEYRPAQQIRAYIRDPRTFRYGNMPSHRDLSVAQLDELLSYFEVMRTQKHDPAAAPGASHDTSHGGSQP